ncbi:MAG: sulfurtransferase TusA family protein [Clostridiales bacterium]|nr:sulfurtransferase TusA family protein [Clostridiales bacterium]
MKIIDCFGEICPIPVLRIEEEIKKANAGDFFMIVVNHSCVVQSIKDKYSSPNIKMKIDEVMNGVWEITFEIT